VYALVKAPTEGWTDSSILLRLGISAAMLIAFIINEARARHPLMPLHIFKIRNLSGANLLQLCMAAGLFANFFFTTLYLQLVLGYTPIKTGVSFLIVPVAIAIVATNVPRVIRRVGYRPILMVAPLFFSAGLFWLSHIPVNGTFWGNVAPGLIVLGMGMGATFVSVSIAATDGVPHHESGLASGILNTAQQIGGAVGLAVLTGVATSATHSYLANLHARPGQGDVAAAMVHGFQKGYLVAATFGIVASLIATLVLRQRADQTDPGQADAALI